MGTLYYYFVASLPLLEFGQKPPFSFKTFLDDCQRLLSKEDFKILLCALSDDNEESVPDNDFLRIWKEFMHNLRNESAWVRASQSKSDPMDYMRGERYADSFITDVIAQAAKSADPLEGEKLIDRARWQKLDELESCLQFGIENIVVYAVKLKILERYQEIETPKGQEIFEKLKSQAYHLE